MEMSVALDYNVVEKRCRELLQKIVYEQIESKEVLEEAIQAAGFPEVDVILVILRTLCKNEDITTPNFLSEEDDLIEKMDNVYWNDFSWVEEQDTRITKLFEISKLLYLWGVFDLEDFRPIARFYYHLSEEREEKRHEITQTFLHKAAQTGLQGEELMHFVRDNYEFIGIPIPTPTEIAIDATELGISSLDRLIEDDSCCQFLRLLKNRFQFLPELIVGRNFQEIISEAHLWLSHSKSTRIMNEFLERALTLLKEKMDGNQFSLEQIREHAESIFREIGLTDVAQEPLSITYETIIHKLGPLVKPSKPLSPSRFESIPKEALNHLLGRISFATPIKKVELIFLGGGEIGRSGILVITSNGSVLLDFGYALTNSQIPRFVPEMRFLDAVLITHAHLDHSGGLPILYRATGYQGPWYGAPLAHELTRLLLANSSELLKSTFSNSLLRSHSIFKHATRATNLSRVHQNFIPLQPSKQVEIAPDVLVTPVPAAHIYGSLGYLLDIAGNTIFYTGDFNLNPTSLFPEAIENNLPTDADFTIFDGTYYGAPNFDYASVDQILSEIVQKSDRTLIPAFSLGRSQEILQRLENVGLTHEKRVILVGMSARIARLVGLNGNYELHERGIPSFEKDTVIISGSGMLSGRSIAGVLFRETRRDPMTGVVLCGWMAKKSLGWDLLNGKISHQCQIGYARISAHSSSDQLGWFIDQLTGKKIMVHSPVLASDVTHENVIRPEYETRIRVA